MKNSTDEFALIAMINNIPNPEESSSSRHVAGHQCKKLTAVKHRTEKKVTGDI